MAEMAIALTAAFANPVLSAQSTFRCIMGACARPGTTYLLPETVSAPPPLSRGAAAVALTLLDGDSPVWLDAPLTADHEVANWLRFHTGARIVSQAKRAAFAILSDPERAPPFEVFALGTPDYPDRSTTLILQVSTLERGRALTFSGPGINGRNVLCTSPLPPDMRQRLLANRALFPLGIDLLLTTETEIAALPRSVKLVEGV
jgi:alpha-D-ribose 1-methylphosphonate 5-triphosphate synthase subunit PhnH